MPYVEVRKKDSLSFLKKFRNIKLAEVAKDISKAEMIDDKKERDEEIKDAKRERTWINAHMDGLEAVAHKESWKVYSISLVSKLYITKQVFDCTLVSAVLQAINALSSHIQSIAFVQLLHHFTLSNGVFSELVVERNSEETSLFEELNMGDWYDLILVENLLPELKRQL